MIKRWISIKEAAEYLSLHEITIRRLIDRRKIPASKVGRSVRVDLEKLNEQMQQHEKV